MESADKTQGKGAWTRLRGRIREAWGALSDDDVDRYEGRLDQLIGFIAQKTGEARETVAEKLNEMSRKMQDET